MMKEGYAEQLLNDGLDESAEELVGMGGIDRLTNGVFRREGGIAKRPGFTFPTSSAVNALNTPKHAGHTLVARGGSLRVLRKVDGVDVTTLGGGVVTASRGRAATGHTDVVAQLHDSRGFSGCDTTVGRRNGVLIACVLGQVSSTETRVDIIEVDTGSLIFRNTLTGINARVVWRESGGVGRFHLYYQVAVTGGYDCMARVLDPVTRDYVGSTTTLNSGNGPAVSILAVCTDSSSAAHTFVAWVDDDDTTIRVKRTDFTGAISSSTTIAGTAGGDTIALCQSVAHPEWLHVVFTTNLTGVGDVYMVGLRADFTGGATTPFVAVATTDVNARIFAVTVFDQGTAGADLKDQLVVSASWSTNTFSDAEVLYRGYGYTSDAGTPTLPTYTGLGSGTKKVTNSMLLAHGMSVFPDDDSASSVARPVLPLVRCTDIPGSATSRLSIPTSYLFGLSLGTNTEDDAATHVDALLNVDESYQGIAGTNLAFLLYRLPGVSRDSTTGDYYLAQLVLEELPAAKVAQYGIKLMRLTFNTLSSYTRPLPRASLGSLTYTGGNLLRCFDGRDIAEAVPVLPPEAPTLAQAASGALTLTKTYSYRCVLLYEDAFGQIHRSAPSPPVNFTLTGSNRTITLAWTALQWPTELITNTTTRKFWRVEVYRTEGDGAVYYYEQEFSVEPGTAYNISDGRADTTIIANKPLYTEGDVLPNECPPPLKALCAVGNRLFGIDATDPRSIVFSKELEEGIAAEFNAALGFRLEASASEPVALGALNDLLVIFTEDEAWAISTHGGPDALGVGSFGLPERIATDCGASGPESVVSIPLGLLVHGRAGMRLLAPGTSASVAVVADSASGDYTVVRALHVPRREEAWFILRGTPDYGRILVVSYARGRVRWMNWNVRDSSAGSLPDIRDADVVDGVPYLLTHSTTGSNREYFLTYLNEDTYRDGALGSSGAGRIHVSVRTRWFKPEGAFGDSRFRALHVLGKYGAGHDLQAKIYVMDLAGSPDDDDGGTDWLRGTADWTAAKLANDDRAIAVRRRLRSQRGAAVRAELTLSDVSSAHTDAGPVLHAVGWDFAVRGSTAPRGASYESE